MIFAKFDQFSPGPLEKTLKIEWKSWFSKKNPDFTALEICSLRYTPKIMTQLSTTFEKKTPQIFFTPFSVLDNYDS